jgi:hypothetical protein
MKKLALSLIASLAFIQSTHAATSALTESLLEYEAITSAIGTNPSFENVISATEFIVDIKRITQQVDITGTVKYEILTRILSSPCGINATVEHEALETRSSGSHHGHHHCHHNTNTYIATLDVTPNPGIGPNIVTVVSIVKVGSQSNTFFEDNNFLPAEI